MANCSTGRNIFALSIVTKVNYRPGAIPYAPGAVGVPVQRLLRGQSAERSDGSGADAQGGEDDYRFQICSPHLSFFRKFLLS